MNTNTRVNRLLIAGCALLAVFSILSIPGMVTVRAQGEAPLLDRELFFGDPEISGSQLSPDGKFITFIKPFKGTRNVWIKRTQEPFASAKPITNETKRPVPSYFWSRDGKYVLYVQDKGGDENYNIYAVNPSESPAAGEDVPKARNLTDLKAVRVFIYELPKNEPDTIYIGLNDRDASWHDLYRLTISTGERTLLRKNTDRLTGWVFDAKGKLRLATRSADNGDTEVLRVDPDGFKKVYSCNVFESCDPVHFHKDGERVYIETNKGGDVDLERLTLFNPATGKEELVESDPMNRVDLTGAVFSDLTDELVATSYVEDRTRVYFKDKAYEADYKWVKKQLGDKEIGFQSLTRDERMAIVSARSDTEPGEVYLFDRNAKKLTLQYRVRENVPRDALSPMKSIKYKSSDGLEIPAYLTLPKGVQAKNLPLIVFPHGGPWARDNWGYNTFAQFLANRGYAVLEPNFRSSTGYGKKFLNAGNLQWGEKMQDDLTWGVKYLVAEGIADPKRVGIMGGSYGGYATLAGVAFTPDVYAAGVSIVGPSNLITLLESIPPYWEAGRVIFHRRMGDPSTPEGKAQLARQSPLNSANKIKAPMLIIQGANDPRVNKAESDQIVIALRDRGFPVEYLVAPDEGHGFARPINNLAMITSAEKFLAKFLGGRYQQDAKPEVATRLKEITVDVKTVTRPVRVEAASVSVPKPEVDLRPGSVAYQAKIEMGGQVVPLSVKREIREEGGTWVVKETAQTPMGELSDQSVLEKGSLVLTQRSVKQGPIVIDLTFKDNKASGQMNMNGEAKQVSADLGGALFADGAGAYDVMAALPLKEGYSATFRNFDVQRQKVKLMQLKVAGIEKVTVPAGTFDAYKVDIASADGASDRSTVWVAKDSRQVVKMTATLPEMGGAILTTELAKQN
jgi:dipeptidyl aminopeptidase/acylaminoacyl peptidase